MFQSREVWYWIRKCSIKLTVREIKINQPRELRNLFWNLPHKFIIWQIKISQLLQLVECWWNGWIEIVISQVQSLEILETEKTVWVVKSTIDIFFSQVKANNISLTVTSNTSPIATSSAFRDKCEIVFELEQQWLLILKTFGRGKSGFESEKNGIVAKKEGKQWK